MHTRDFFLFGSFSYLRARKLPNRGVPRALLLFKGKDRSEALEKRLRFCNLIFHLYTQHIRRKMKLHIVAVTGFEMIYNRCNASEKLLDTVIII